MGRGERGGLNREIRRGRQVCISDRVKAGANLADVVKALNSLGASPADLMSILQAMKASGALRADLEII